MASVRSIHTDCGWRRPESVGTGTEVQSLSLPTSRGLSCRPFLAHSDAFAQSDCIRPISSLRNIIKWLLLLAGLISVTACSTQQGTNPDDTSVSDTTASGAALDTVTLTLPTAPQLASKGNHSCVLRVDGRLVCWGNWGVGPTPPTPVPPPLDQEGAAVRFAAVTQGGGGNLCALSTEGEVYCITAFRQVYDPADTVAPHHVFSRIATRRRFRAIVSSHETSCGLTPRGLGFCWGKGENGGLGNGRYGEGYEERLPVQVTSPVELASLAVSTSENQCALTVDGRAYCWGGQYPSIDFLPELLGDCSDSYWLRFAGRPCATATPTASTHRFSMLAVGGLTLCGLDQAGLASCWGSGTDGQLGDGRSGNGTYSLAPSPVAGSIHFAALANRGTSVCGLGLDGRGHCWGSNFRGFLGRIGLSSAVPVPVGGDHVFTSISSGALHTCGLDQAGEIWCWGAADQGVLGRPAALGDAFEPVLVAMP